MDVITLSSSRALAYLHCPQGYWYRYESEETKLPNARMTRGIVFHNTMKFNYRQKYGTHEDLPVRDLKEYFAADFDLTETEFGSDDPGEIKDSGIAALAEYQSVVAPYVQPLEVEESFVMDFKQVDWNFQGKVDLVDVNGTLIETKTTSRGLKAPKQDHLIQVSAYTLAYKRKKGIKDAKTRIDYSICGQKNQRVISFDLEVTESHERSFLNLLAQVARGIENDVWFHNRIDNFCSRRYCAYWRECETDCGGRVRD